MAESRSSNTHHDSRPPYYIKPVGSRVSMMPSDKPTTLLVTPPESRIPGGIVLEGASNHLCRELPGLCNKGRHHCRKWGCIMSFYEFLAFGSRHPDKNVS